MELKKALSQIRPTAEQREKIYGDILEKLDRADDLEQLSENRTEEKKETRIIMKKRTFISAATAAVLAVVIAGGTVYAAATGWAQKLFGSSAAIVESSIDDYKLKVGNVKIENAEGVPYKFTLGDVLTDGNNVYFNLLVEDMPAELDEFGDWNDPGTAVPPDGSMCRSSWQTSSWMTTGKNENIVSTAVYARFSKKFEKGDVLEFRFNDDRRRLDPLNHIDEAENARAFLANISFEIESDVRDLTKTLDVNQTAIFKDRWPYSPEWGGEAPNEDKLTKLEMYVETIGISPFGIEINGTIDSSQPTNTTAYASWGNIWLIYKNGDRISVTPQDSQLKNMGDYYDAIYYCNFSNSYGGKPFGVQDLNEIEAIEFDGFTVPLNPNPVSETEE